MPGIPFTKDDPRINREGRPVGARSFTTKVKEALEKIAEGKDYTYEEAFIKSILKKAIVDGDASTQRLIWNYLDGMPAQSLDVKGSLTISQVLDQLENGSETEGQSMENEQSVQDKEQKGKTNEVPTESGTE